MIQYINYLKSNEKALVPKLEFLLAKYKVQPVGSGYFDCIVMKANLEMFIKEITDLGILITETS
ncbi:hypothetical protein AABM38_10685 [Heyndrickxia sp. MSNUG]|uniref:hypothetical protein n=1 Tax=Heyndrickxia sp. MSNUG TaxID=3136677 RepID=UPI003C2AE582